VRLSLPKLQDHYQQHNGWRELAEGLEPSLDSSPHT
jgi:hypothetical protein